MHEEKYPHLPVKSDNKTKTIDTDFDLLKSVPKLSKKAAIFVQKYFSNGFNATAAYMASFSYDSKISAGHKAANLLKSPPVEQAIEILSAHIAEEEQIKRSDIVKVLKRTMSACENTDDRYNLLKTVDLLCKMAGFYVNEKPPQALVKNEINVSFGGFDPDKDESTNNNIIDVNSETLDDENL